MQLQKLVYISHGWNLAINNAPLVNELPEAWDNGPVFRSIWNQLRDIGYSHMPDGPRAAVLIDRKGSVITESLDSSEINVISHVWNKYRSYSGYDLSRMNHLPNTPWYKAYFERGKNAALSNREIQEHYVELAMAGRA